MILTSSKRGFTLVEVVVFGAVGCALMVLCTGLLVRIFKQDTWNAGRMDAVAMLATAHVQIAEDRWLGREVLAEAGGEAVRVKLFGSATRSDEVVYRWSGARTGLRRAGRPVGSLPLEGFTCVARHGVTGAVELAVRAPAGEGRAPHRVRMTVPLRVPDAGRHHAFAYFTGTGPGDGEPMDRLPDPALP